MNNSLLIRFVDHRQDQIEWIASGSRSSNQMPISDMAEMIKRHPVVWIVPADKTMITQVMLPKGRASQIMAAIPYALEDTLASDIDELHFTALKPTEDQKTPVIVSDEAWMLAHWKILYDHGIQPNRAIVDVLSLPQTEAHWTLLEEPHRVWVKQTNSEGFCCEKELLLPLLQQWTNHQASENTPKIRAYCQSTDNVLVEQLTSLGMVVERLKSPSLLVLIRDNMQHTKEYNLLTGLQIPEHNKRGDVKPWLPASILFVLSLLLYSFILIYQYRDLIEKEGVAQSQLTSIFRQAFPHVNRIQDELVQAQQALNEARISQPGNQSPFLHYLYALGSQLKKVSQVRVLTFYFHQSRLKVEILTKDIATLEQLKQLLETHHQLNLTILSTVNKKVGVRASIVIKGVER